MVTELSPRQRELVRLRAMGLTRKEAADVMGVKIRTVNAFTDETYRRTDARCLQDVLRAIGWLRVPEA